MWSDVASAESVCWHSQILLRGGRKGSIDVPCAVGCPGIVRILTTYPLMKFIHTKVSCIVGTGGTGFPAVFLMPKLLPHASVNRPHAMWHESDCDICDPARNSRHRTYSSKVTAALRE